VESRSTAEEGIELNRQSFRAGQILTVVHTYTYPTRAHQEKQPRGGG